MVIPTNPYSFLFICLFLSNVLFVNVAKAEECTDPRPKICTMDYNPVCGTKADGALQTYSNGCGACSDPQVSSYTAGECIEEVAESFDEKDSVWHQAKLRGVNFRAVGQEPGWLLEITNNEKILLVTDYGQWKKEYPYVKPTDDSAKHTTTYQVTENTKVAIEKTPCMDNMSGEKFSYSVTISKGETILKGCGRDL